MEWDIDNRVMNQMAFEERVSRALPTQNCVVSGFPLLSVILLLGHSSNQATSCSFLKREALLDRGKTLLQSCSSKWHLEIPESSGGAGVSGLKSMSSKWSL